MAYGYKPITDTFNEISRMITANEQSKQQHQINMAKLGLQEAQLKNQQAIQELKLPGLKLEAEKNKYLMEPVNVNLKDFTSGDAYSMAHVVNPKIESEIRNIYGAQRWNENLDAVDENGVPIQVPRWQRLRDDQAAYSIIAANSDYKKFLEAQRDQAQDQLDDLSDSKTAVNPKEALKIKSQRNALKRTTIDEADTKLGSSSALIEGYMNHYNIMNKLRMRVGANNPRLAQILKDAAAGDLAMVEALGKKSKGTENRIKVDLFNEKTGKYVKSVFLPKNLMSEYVPPEGLTIKSGLPKTATPKQPMRVAEISNKVRDAGIAIAKLRAGEILTPEFIEQIAGDDPERAAFLKSAVGSKKETQDAINMLNSEIVAWKSMMPLNVRKQLYPEDFKDPKITPADIRKEVESQYPAKDLPDGQTAMANGYKFVVKNGKWKLADSNKK